MRTLAPWMRELLDNGGPFVGQFKASSRVTVEPAFYLHTSSGPVGNWPAKKLPIRWWQRADNSQIEVEIPNIKSVQITRDLTQQAATVQVAIYNSSMDANGVMGSSNLQLGEPGFFSWSYAGTAQAKARWNQTPNAWANVLTENALIRTYQGYGGQDLTIPDAVAAGNLIMTGAFLLDSPAIESSGVTTLAGRDMGKLLIDQQTIPDTIPRGRYPLNYYGPGQNLSTWDGAPGYGVNSWNEQRGVFKADSGGGVGMGDQAWVSNDAGSPDGVVWLEMSCGESASGVYVSPMWGGYVCYVAVKAGGVWQGSGDVGGLPYVTSFNVGFETPSWHAFPRTYLASDVRLNFTKLYHYQGKYVAAIREVTIGSNPTVTQAEKIVLDLDTVPDGCGYRLCGSDGGVFDYGSASFHGCLFGRVLVAGVVGIAGTHDSGGYWLAAADGGVFSFGNAVFHGSLGGVTLAAPIVALKGCPSGSGYWMLGADGGVFSFGAAGFHGSAAGSVHNFEDMTPRPQGDGYWLMQEDGTVHAFGGAVFHGNGIDVAGGDGIYTAIESTVTGNGYWLVADNGAVFSFGDAAYHGGANVPSPRDPSGLLNAPVSGMRRTKSGLGYWLVAQDGGVFSYGDARFYGSLPGNFVGALPADYNDYSQIIVDLALWAGFWLHPGTPLPGGKPPAVFGNIESTGGAYDTLGPLGIDFFDKRPVIDVMSDIATLVGYLVRVDEIGGLRFESPNCWSIGNFDDEGHYTSYLPVLDERINLTDFTMTQSDQDLRSPILVTVSDPYLWGGAIPNTNVTTFIPPYTPRLKGIIKPAMFAVPLVVDAKDQQYFAELIALRIWFQTRTGSLTAWCDPSICVNDQVRIYERNSAETNVHYVQALTTNHDLDSGKFEMQLSTYWLGGNDVGWAVTANLDSFFGPGATKPHTVLTPTPPGQTFDMSAQLSLLLAQSGAASTQGLSQDAMGLSITVGGGP